MPDIEKLANAIYNRLGSLAINSEFCCRVRSSLSSCRSCADVCPTGEIVWKDAVLEVGQCLECGLCTSVCPTGALSWRQPSSMQLIEKVRELAAVSGEVCIYCRKLAPKKFGPQDIIVPCLGTLSWEIWLHLLCSPVSFKVYLPQGPCDDCDLKNGRDLWEQMRAKAEALSDNKITVVSSLESRRVNKVEPQMNRDRRRLFGALLGGLVKIPGKVVNGIFQEEQKKSSRIAQNSETMSARRLILIRAIERSPVLADRVKVKLPRVVGNCQFCQACSILCPQGAIQLDHKEETAILKLNEKLCSSCNLCVEACFYKVIKLEHCSVAKFETGFELVKGQEFSCTNCGSGYTAAVEQNCPACQKKVALNLWGFKKEPQAATI